MVGSEKTPFLPRLLLRPLEHALSVFPVVVITGARQTGKTTLVRRVGGRRAYLTLDDLDVKEQAESAPDDLLRRAERITIDEPLWRRPYRHPELGLVSLEKALALYAWHGRHHVAHITRLRERRGWS